jgi:YaiO family outer membrane protein
MKPKPFCNLFNLKKLHDCFYSPAIVLCLAVLLIIPFKAAAQQVDNVDEAFREARTLAFDGNRDEARILAYAILEISPNYHDVRILIARTYSWDGSYNEAREELNYVLEQSPSHRDAHLAAIDNEVWSEEYQQAIFLARQASNFYPVDEQVLLKRAGAHYSAGEEREALRVLNQIEQINPSNGEAQELRRSIRTSLQNYILTASYTQDRFEEFFGTTQRSYLQLSRRTPYGSVIGRLNYQNRFSTDGLQAEIDFYPSIADGWYGYLNAGYSSSSIFPEFRGGAELHRRLPRSFEGSLGVRYLNFSGSQIFIYTGSLTKYYGNWLFAVRPFVTPSSVGFSRSFNFTIRRYYAGPENYATLRGGFGFSPEERRFQDVSGDIFLTQSQFIGIDGFKTVRYNLAVFASFDIARQELSFDPGEYIRILTFNGGIQIKF